MSSTRQYGTCGSSSNTLERHPTPISVISGPHQQNMPSSKTARDSEAGDEETLHGKHRFPLRLHHFTWPWFACTMSTGAIAVVLSQQPYAFRGLDTIGKIFFLLDLVLLLCFTAAIAFRFSKHPRKFWWSLHRSKEALFFGSFWVSWALIITCIQQYGVKSCGPWLVKVVEILFWIYAGCAGVTAVMQYSTLFIAEQVSAGSVMPTWIFPVYPFLVIGPLASVIIPSQPAQSALNIFIGGVMFQGLGWCISLFMYTIYVLRLMSSELPPPPGRPGMFVGVGPAGYTSAALVGLGVQASKALPPTFLGLNGSDVGAVLKVMGVFTGLFVWLVSFWFFALAVIAVLSDVKKMTFTLNWWGFVFPNAGMTLGVIQIGNALDSSPIKGIASALTILLVVAWFFVAISHIVAVVKKTILFEGQDEDQETSK